MAPISPNTLQRIKDEVAVFIHQRRSAVLSTTDPSGLPHASYAPFVQVNNNAFYIYASSLSQHTSNLRINPLVSFLLIEDESTAQQIYARERLTFLCDVETIERSSTQWGVILGTFEKKFGSIVEALRSLQDFQLFQLLPRCGFSSRDLVRPSTLKAPPWRSSVISTLLTMGLRKLSDSNCLVTKQFEMVKTKFSLFQMKIKYLFVDTLHLAQAKLRLRPERLDPIDMRRVISKLMTSMVDSVMFRIPLIDQSMIFPSPIGVGYTVQTHFPPNDTLQGAFPGIRNDLGIDLCVAFKKTKDDRFATRSPPAFSTDSSGSEIRFIHCNLAPKLGLLFTLLRQTNTNFDENRADRSDRDSGQSSGIRGGQIRRKVADNLPKCLLCDLGTLVIPVFTNHFRRLTPINKCLIS